MFPSGGGGSCQGQTTNWTDERHCRVTSRVAPCSCDARLKTKLHNSKESDGKKHIGMKRGRLYSFEGCHLETVFLELPPESPKCKIHKLLQTALLGNNSSGIKGDWRTGPDLFAEAARKTGRWVIWLVVMTLRFCFKVRKNKETWADRSGDTSMGSELTNV